MYIDLFPSDRRYASWDHVMPRGAGGPDEFRNMVLAHRDCNERKDIRQPYPCEAFFCEVTNEIATAIQEARDLS